MTAIQRITEALDTETKYLEGDLVPFIKFLNEAVAKKPRNIDLIHLKVLFDKFRDLSFQIEKDLKKIKDDIEKSVENEKTIHSIKNVSLKIENLIKGPFSVLVDNMSNFEANKNLENLWNNKKNKEPILSAVMKPIQRAQKYKLFFNEIIKDLEKNKENSSLIKPLGQLVEHIEDSLNEVNNSTKYREKIFKKPEQLTSDVYIQGANIEKSITRDQWNKLTQLKSQNPFFELSLNSQLSGDILTIKVKTESEKGFFSFIKSIFAQEKEISLHEFQKEYNKLVLDINKLGIRIRDNKVYGNYNKDVCDTCENSIAKILDYNKLAVDKSKILASSKQSRSLDVPSLDDEFIKKAQSNLVVYTHSKGYQGFFSPVLDQIKKKQDEEINQERERIQEELDALSL